MANDFHIPDFGDDRELQLNHEEYEIWLNDPIAQAEYQQYLEKQNAKRTDTQRTNPPF